MRKLLVASAVVALLATACGSGGGGPPAGSPSAAGGEVPVSSNPVGLLRASAGVARNVGSARFAMTISAGFTFGGEGALDLQNGTGTLSFDLGALFQQIAGGGSPPPSGVPTALELIYAGTSVYFKVPSGSDLGEGIEWLKIDASKFAASGASGGNILGGASDPSGFVTTLAGVSGEPADLGPETVRGVPTRGYQVNIDLKRALEKAPAAQREALKGSFGIYEDAVPARVWLDGQGLVRKIEMSLTAEGQTATVALEFFDYGKAVTIEVPSGDVVIEAESESDLTELIGQIFAP